MGERAEGFWWVTIEGKSSVDEVTTVLGPGPKESSRMLEHKVGDGTVAWWPLDDERIEWGAYIGKEPALQPGLRDLERLVWAAAYAAAWAREADPGKDHVPLSWRGLPCVMEADGAVLHLRKIISSKEAILPVREKWVAGAPEDDL